MKYLTGCLLTILFFYPPLFSDFLLEENTPHLKKFKEEWLLGGNTEEDYI